MKKLTIALALILCLVLCLFAFASCGKKKAAETEAPGTSGTTGTTGATGTTAHAHVPAENYTTDKEATCGADGSESKHCTVCDEIIASTVRAIPATEKHTAGAWTQTVAPSLIAEGAKTTTCTVCGADMEESIDKTEPIVYVTNWDDATRKANPNSILNPDYTTNKPDEHYIFGVQKHVQNLVGNGVNFYPTDENDEGNDLLVEFSFLYNETMANATGDATLAAMYVENNNVFNVDLKTGKITATKRTGDERLFEADNAVSHEVPIGAYGWHRFGMRIHETATNVAGEVKYTVTATAYLDGAKILVMDKTTWATQNFTGDYTGLLYTATIEGGDLTYKNAVNDGKHCDVYVMVEEMFANKNDPKAGYLVVGDVNFSCGKTFKQDVVKLTNPVERTLVVNDKGTDDVADDVVVPASFYYDFRQVSVNKMTSSSTGNYDNKKLLSEIQGDKHFYPDASNGNQGNDLLVEFSVLWNDTLLNLAPGSSAATSPFITSRIANWTGGDDNVLTYWSPTNDVQDAWCKYAGGFEAGTLQTVAPAGLAFTPAGMCASGGNYAAYPNIGGADQANPEYGWHRIGIRYHFEVENTDDVIAGTADPIYYATYSLYFDGACVSILEGRSAGGGKMLKAQNYLFTAEHDDDTGIKYNDNPNLTGADSVKRTIFAFRFNCMKTKADTTAYWADADVYYSCGKNFVQQVEKVDNPVAVNFVLDDMGTPENTDDVTCSGAMYYRVID